MTQPQQEPNVGSNPPNPAPPHAPNPSPPEVPRPVIVNTDTGLSDQVASMATTLRALPETLVNAFREATSGVTPPAASTTPPAVAPPAAVSTQATHQANVEQSGYKGPGRVASWFFGIKKAGQ